MNKKQEILSAYNFRHACKEFDNTKKISDEDFEFILETGRLSPSSFGFEPWKFLVVQNQELREKLKEVSWGAQKQLPTSSHFLVMLARKGSTTVAGSEYINHIMKNIQELPGEVVTMKGDFYGNFQKNDFDLTDDRKLFDWASRQMYIPLGNMMTSAAQIGVDSCPIEGFDKEKVDQLLKSENIINDEFGVACMLAFGYRPENLELRPKARQVMKDVVEWI
ncbi:MAG: NAD(P)H-dependent oxidoreductase [Acidaminobacteraceae bacterium]